MRPSTAYVVLLPLILLGCTTTPRLPTSVAGASGPNVTLYSAGDGHSAWHVQANRFWRGHPGELLVAPLDQAEATVRYWRDGGVACVGLDEETIFGVPDTLRKGDHFRCGAATFEVLDCDFPDDCVNAQIEARWQVGVAPDYGELPVLYLYNWCRGIQSISFYLDRPAKVDFGSVLELRQGPGLLARPDSPACMRDYTRQFYGNR